VSAVATRPRLGFLGVGWIGRHRLEALESSGAADVAAIADPAVDGALASFDELLERELDGIVIATPSALHAEQAIRALEHGLAVFCQKPLGRNEAETRAVVDAARRADRLLGVDLSYRRLEAVQQIRALIDPRKTHAADLTFHNAYGPDKPWFYDPALAGGGCVIDLGIHLVDLALWLLEWPEVVDVRSRLDGEPVEQYATAELELATGASVRLACSWNLPLPTDVEISARFYERGRGLHLENVPGSFFDFRALRVEGRRVDVLAEPPDDWGGRAAVEWAQQLARSPAFDPEIERATDVARVVDAIYGSAA